MTPTFSRALTVIALLLATLKAQAAPVVSITVPDFSFEAPGSPVSSSSDPNLVPGWIFNGNTSAYGTATISSNFQPTGIAAANGTYFAFLNHDIQTDTNTITSATSLGLIQNQTVYSLTVAVGNLSASDNGSYGAPGEVTLSLLANGHAFATLDIPAGTVPNGTFEDFTLTTKKGDSDPYLGENLTIQMASVPFGDNARPLKAAFDNVELTSELVPEPSTWALLATALLPLGLLRQKRRA